MRRKVLIGSSILGISLTLIMLVIGVYAAMNNTVGILNTIKFSCSGVNVAFKIEGQITGTDNDGASYLTMNPWNYEFERDGNRVGKWEISKPLNFYHMVGDESVDPICYTFTILNKSVNTLYPEKVVPLKISIDYVDVDTAYITYTVVGNHAVIQPNETSTIEVRLLPKSINNKFGAKACKFTIKIDEVVED